MSIPNDCPSCGANFDGGPIPEEYREAYCGDRFSRAISIYSREEDRTIAMKCPDCGFEVPQ